MKRTSVTCRADLQHCNRIVIKCGSAIVSNDESISLSRLGALVDQISTLVRAGKSVILVSSGSIALGKQVLRRAGEHKVSFRERVSFADI